MLFLSVNCFSDINISFLCHLQVKRSQYLHTYQSKRSGVCKGVTQFWVCEQVIDWLKEDATVGATELQRRLKDEYKILILYRRVWNGKNLALDKLYGT